MTDDEFSSALAVLAAGGVVAVATETFYGLLADARRSEAIDRVFQLKGSDAAKGVALILPRRAAWRTVVTDIPPLADQLADAFWPGPLTIVLRAEYGLDERLQSDGTIGVRLPGPSDASRLAAAFHAPLTATSANLAGESPARRGKEIMDAFAEPVRRGELFVVSGESPGGAPSTLVRVEGERLKILREGQIPKSDLVAVVPAAAFG